MAWSKTPLLFEAIGTKWQIDLPDGLLASRQEKLLIDIKNRIDIFDHNYSRFRDDSLVTAMSKKAGKYRLPPDAQPLFKIYENLYRITNGLVTPLIGDVLVAAGYDKNYSLKPGKLSSPLAWDEVLERQEDLLIIKKPTVLDFGAAGKGYLIDIVAELIRKAGVTSFCVDAGGDMAYYDNDERLRVGLEHPLDSTEVIGITTIKNQSLCGSAGNRRVWDKFHHIINPKTLESVTEILAVWTIAPITLLADALTTALFFTDASVLQAEYQFEYLLVRSDLTVEKSEGFPVELFKA
jgi:thiamine biosynthesis lipoprotein